MTSTESLVRDLRTKNQGECTGAVPSLPSLGDMLSGAWERAERRARGDERPIPLPFSILSEHFAGGLWPGVHFLTAGTGIGKSQIAMQVAMHAVRAGIPAAYVGLELEAFQIAMRAIGLAAGVPWSKLYTGHAGPAWMAKAKDAIASLRELPFHPVFGRPHGWPASELGVLGERMRALYPETRGAGSRPLLLVLDFLQIIGPEPNDRTADLRQRIGDAAYQCRALAANLNIAVLVISSVARHAYGLSKIAAEAGLSYDEDESGRPVHRRILNPDVLVGLGKESGEIEYSGDSVSVLFKEPATAESGGVDVVFATAKGRATPALWSPLRFTGFAFEECPDRGGRLVDAWKSIAEKRETAKAERASKREQERADKGTTDVINVVRFVMLQPGCTVRDARSIVGHRSDRWSAVVLRLGPALVQRKEGRGFALTIDRERLPEEVSSCI